MLLRPFDVYFFGLRCVLDQLRLRETTRGDRPLGSVEQDYRTVHQGRTYDLELDGTCCAKENAQRILTGWRSSERRSEFSQRG